MAMKVCKDCGTEVSKRAKSCPKCGRKMKHTALRVTIGIIVVILGIGLLLGDTTNVQNITPTVNTSIQELEKMTLEKFNRIQTGMTYDEVVAIAEEEGTLSTESSYGNQTMKIYYWYALNGISNATVSFINGKVTAKSQIGLN